MLTEPIRVLVADDHMVVRAGLSRVLGTIEALLVVAEAENGEEALFLCNKHRPDIVLMDVRMQGVGGLGATELIGRYHPDVRVIALSTFDDRDTVNQMIAAGAKGFMPKTVSVEALANAIVRVHRGETVIGVEWDVPEADKGSAPADTGNVVPLRAQQRRVLALLTKGYTNTEIAVYLGISMHTVRYHVSAILLKLGAANRAEAAAVAIRDELVNEADF